VSERLRWRRHGRSGRSWYLDETYVKVNGRLRYLYRAIDRDGTCLIRC
jgi:putative transposase